MFDLHTHTFFSDGANSPEEMIDAALEKGLTCIGFSDHSHVDWDECGMTEENTEAYRREIARLKRSRGAEIEIRCGLERDYYSDDDREYDDVIGSVHWMLMSIIGSTSNCATSSSIGLLRCASSSPVKRARILELSPSR